MDTFKTREGERIEQLERDKVALMAEIQDLKRVNFKAIELLTYRDGGAHDSDCRFSSGRGCNCEHDNVAEFLNIIKKR